MLKRFATFCVSLSLLGACTATPDLAGWAQNSADLASAINLSNQTVLERIDRDITRMKIGQGEKWPTLESNPQLLADWEGWRDEYAENVEAINATMEVMTLYANELAVLAAAGESGREASDSILKSVNTITEAVGIAYPGSELVNSLLGEVAELTTRVQAQDSLAATMQKMQTTVEMLAEAVASYTDAQDSIVVSLDGLERDLINDTAGSNRMSWYVRNSGYKWIEDQFDQLALDRVSAERVHSIVNLLERLESRYRDREQERAELTVWVDSQRDALARIAAAADAWRSSHEDAARILAACGGLRSLRNSCGNYTAANLKLAAERIRNIANAS